MLILGDLSGIQDFLFDVPEEGGRQARQLRARSFRIQLLAECAALRLLHVLGLGLDRLLFSTAGKFLLDARGATGAVEAVRRETGELERWLLDYGRGQLRLSVVVEPDAGSHAVQYVRAIAALQQAKLSCWRAAAVHEGRWRPRRLVLSKAPDRDAQAEQDKDIGRQLLAARWVLFQPGGAEGRIGDFECAGVRVSLRRDPPAHASPDLLAVGILHDQSPPPNVSDRLVIHHRLACHIPINPDGTPVEFLDLAARAAGSALLGVLKADVDSLGLAIARRLDQANDLGPLLELSGRLEEFFSVTLDDDLRDNWPTLYTVFAGGDDLLLVGPWDAALDFAFHLRQQFARRFAREGLTISAGLAFTKPKKPIASAAAHADSLLEQAKRVPACGLAVPKDQLACLDEIWKWDDHEKVLGAAKRLAEWVRAGTIPRSSLHTLLELALIRQGRYPGPQRIPPAMATSRLAYHVARNFPGPGDPSPLPRQARQWADRLIDDFDRLDSTRNAQMVHLPAVIRYALLATRKESDRD